MGSGSDHERQMERVGVVVDVTAKSIADEAERMGLAGRPLLVHSSLSSFGWVIGGSGAIIDGLLEPGCTVMVPSFTGAFTVPPPEDQRPERNGWDYVEQHGPNAGVGRVYSPDNKEIDRDMGAISAAVLSKDGAVRGDHPICPFAAVGPAARELIAGQAPLDVFAPIRQLGRLDGVIVMMGVGLNSMTALHLAEQISGRQPFRRWANGPDGVPMQAAVGGCSRGFPRMDSLLASLERRTQVGQSVWRVFPAQPLLDRAAHVVREQPKLTHCGDVSCLRCDDAVAGGHWCRQSCAACTGS